MQEVIHVSPEGIEVANAYLACGDVQKVARQLSLPVTTVTELLAKKEIKRYLDNVYLDLGYRNRNKIASVMDQIIESKIEEANESGMWSSKDLADLLQMAHKMRMDEIKASIEAEKGSAQTNIQVNNDFGGGNYGKLMEALLANG